MLILGPTLDLNEKVWKFTMSYSVTLTSSRVSGSAVS